MSVRTKASLNSPGSSPACFQAGLHYFIQSNAPPLSYRGKMTYLLFTIALGQRPRAMGGHTVAETPIELPGKNCKNFVLILASPRGPRKGGGGDFRRGQLERTSPKT